MEKTQKAKLTIEKQPKTANGLESREKLAKMLETKITQTRENLSKKKYIVDGGVAIGESLEQFMTNTASWKFTEAMGVIEAVKQLQLSIKAINDKKTKELYVDPLLLEAVYYFLTKVEGVGLHHAASYLAMLRPVSEALGSYKEDKDKLDQMVRDHGTVQHAIDNGVGVEHEDEILKEIEDEFKNVM